MMLQCISCIGILLYLSPDLPQCQYVIRYLSTCASPTQKAMVVLKHVVGYMAGHSDQYVSLKWKRMHIQVCFVTMNVKSLFWKFSVMQTGLLTETPEDRFLAVQSSMEDAWFTHPRGPRRSCHYRAQSLKHMLPLQLSWMPSSLGPFCVGYSKFESSCISTWILQLEGEFSHVGVLVV